MQHLSQTVSPALPHPCLRALRAAFPQTIPVLGGYFVLGLGYGIYVQSLGLPVWMPMLMGTVVYGGSLEFVLASLLLGAFSPLSAFLMALMIQARHLFYGLAMLHDDDIVAEAVCESKVMADEHVGHVGLFLQTIQQIEDGLLNGYVKSRGGFVADDDLRLEDQSTCDSDTLALTAGHVVRIAIGEIFGKVD